ncbi:MAG: hypothetical protein M0P95_08510 [Sulfuritalea sp.]|jgi:phage-related protein|nr:hypothetical protein [Sulfuritalea sp.]
MLKPPQKLLIWLGNSLDAVKSFSPDAKREAGHQLGFVQDGREPADWKPMETVGAGVKKTRRTPKADIDLANKRYRDLLTERKKK